MLAPDSWDAQERNDSSEPRLVHLPINRKVLSSLIWDIWSFLTNNNLLMFRLPASSLVAQAVKHLLTMQETRVWSLAWEDPLEKETTHSSTLAWKIPWMEECGRLQSMGSQTVGQDWATSLHFHLLFGAKFYITDSSRHLLGTVLSGSPEILSPGLEVLNIPAE